MIHIVLSYYLYSYISICELKLKSDMKHLYVNTLYKYYNIKLLR